MCETRGHGIKWPLWYTLLFEGEVVDMRVVCPEDVKKMLRKQARMIVSVLGCLVGLGLTRI